MYFKVLIKHTSDDFESVLRLMAFVIDASIAVSSRKNNLFN